MGFLIPRIIFRTPRAAPRIPRNWNSPRAPRMALSLRRGIGVGVKGVTGRDAIVAQELRNSSLMFNYCATIAPQNPQKQGEVPGNQPFVGTIALPSVNYCATIASLPATPLTPIPLLREKGHSENVFS